MTQLGGGAEQVLLGMNVLGHLYSNRYNDASFMCILQHSFEDMLSLEAFACEEGVLIQFAPVNKYGRSKPYSPSDILNVYGGKKHKVERKKTI